MERLERRPVCHKTAHRTITWRGVFGRWARCGHVGGLGVLVVLLSAGGSAVQAQTQSEDWRLSVRPLEAATGQSTARAGEQPLDSLASVYVPAGCVGPQRCPLVLFLQAPYDTARYLAPSVAAAPRAFADRYGAIVLAAERTVMDALDTKSSPNPFIAITAARAAPQAVRRIDRLLQQVLGTYAIEPRKIALVGYGSSDGTLGFGCANLVVFNRLALLSPRSTHRQMCEAGVPRNPGARVYVSGGLGTPTFVGTAVRFAQQLRPHGYTVEGDLALRGYQERPDDFERLWQWLGESWAASAAPPPGSSPPAEPGPRLTAQALRQMTTFWTRFLQEPDSIRMTARLGQQRPITVPVRAERFTLRMMDTPALAARYPSVAAALRAAGLTAQQADAYRTALVIAAANMATWRTGGELAPVPAGSPLGRNLAFMRAHKELLKVLGSTGMWTMP